MKRVLIKLIRQLHHDQRGQGLVFAAMSFLFVVMSVSMVYNVGQVASTKMAVQNAADSGALSAAMVQANCLSTIGWVNSGMAQIHHALLRQVADLNTFAVLAEFEDPGGCIRSGAYARMTSEQQDEFVKKRAPWQVIWGMTHPYGAEVNDSREPRFACAKLAELRQQAEVIFPEAKRWLMELSNIGQSMALMAPILMNEEIDKAVMSCAAGVELGELETASSEEIKAIAENVCKSVFFGSRLYPLDDDNIDMLVERLTGAGGETIGWRVTVTRTGEPTEIIEVTMPRDNYWVVRNTKGIEQSEFTLEQHDEEGLDYTLTLTPPGSTWTIDGGKFEYQDEEYYEWTIRGPSENIYFRPRPDLGDGAYQFKMEPGMSDWEIYRRDDTGTYRYEDGQWRNLTQEEREVDGYRVRVTNINVVNCGPFSVALGDPPGVSFGNTWMRLSKPVHMTHRSGSIKLSVLNDQFKIAIGRWNAGLIDPENADGRWHKHFDGHSHYWWQHRMTEITPDLVWEYNYEVMGSLLKWENNRYRFALHHGARWNYQDDYRNTLGLGADFESAVAAGALPDWMYWMGVASLPDGEEEVGLSFRPRSPSGNSWDPADPPDKSNYYQLRTCWHCGPNWGVDPDDSDAPCPVCRGVRHTGATMTHVCYRPIDTDHDGNNTGLYRIPWKDFLAPEFFNFNDRNANSFGVDGAARPPLVLPEEFFKYGINVATWADPWPGLGSNEEDDDSEGGLTPMFVLWQGRGSNEWSEYSSLQSDRDERPFMPDWGCLSVSSARAGFNDRDFTWNVPDGAEDDPSRWTRGSPRGWTFFFRKGDERDQWLDGETGQGNLYVSEWSAKLVPTKIQIDPDDLDLIDDVDGEGNYDTPAGWLYGLFLWHGSQHYGLDENTFQSSKILQDYSLKPVPSLQRMNIRRRDGNRLQMSGTASADGSGSKFDDYVHH